MKEIKLSNGFYQYQFEAPESTILGQNIFVLYHNKECIIFDAGYPVHMSKLKEKLSDYSIKFVIITHFHPDHCYGLDVLDKQHVIGSKHAVETLDNFEQGDNDILIPSTFVDDTLDIQFYDHNIHITLNPGHSACGTVISINNKFALIGDELLSTNDDEMCLPYVATTIENHIKSLKYILENYQGKVCLPSHGNMIKDLNSEIDKRLAYLNFASTLNSNIEEFYKDKDYRFLNNKWHISNIE